MKRLFFSILFVMTATVLHAAPSPETEKLLWEAWRSAYGYFEYGDLQMQKKDYAAALKAFRSAKAEYERISRMDPEWNAKIIGNRITLAAAAIAGLEKLPESENKALSADTALPSGETELREALISARKALKSANEDLAEAKRRAAGNQIKSADMEALMREKRELEDRLSILDKRRGELEAKLDDPASEIGRQKKLLLQAIALNDDLSKKLELSQTREKTQADGLKRTEALAEKYKQDAEKARTERDLAVRSLEASKKIGTARSVERDDYAEELKLRDRKLSAAEKEVSALREDNKKLESRIAMMRKGGGLDKLNITVMDENRAMKAKVLAAETRLEEQVAAVRESDRKRLELQKENVEFKDSIGRLSARISVLENELKTTQAGLSRETAAGKLIRVELENLRGVNKELKTAITALTEKNTAMQERLDTRGKSEIQSLSDLNEKLKKLAEANTGLLERHDALNSKLAASRKESDTLTAELKRLQENAAVLSKDGSAMKKTMEKQASDLKELAALRQNNAEMRETLRNLRLENVVLKQKSGSAVASDAESAVRKTMLEAAAAAEKDGDRESAVWYYSELLKLEPGNREFAAKLKALKQEQ